MDFIRLYYYTSIPILTCNMLFYSITILSTSITSSQNVIKFVTENKICDSVRFKDDLETLDIQNKLKIVESLIFDILKKSCNTVDEYNSLKTFITNPDSKLTTEKELDDFILVEFDSNMSDSYPILNNIDEPLKLSLLSTLEVTQHINNIIMVMNNKIITHNKSYLNKFITLCLKKELNKLTKYTNLLDKRLQILFELVKIYIKN